MYALRALETYKDLVVMVLRGGDVRLDARLYVVRCAMCDV